MPRRPNLDVAAAGIEPAFRFRSALGDGSWKNQGGMEGLIEA